MKKIELIIIVIAFAFGACEEKSSDEIGSTPIYQRYKVEFSEKQDVKAFAHFSENKDSDYKSVELIGDQKISVNNRKMAYNDIDEQEDFSYSYSAILGKGIKIVTFVFVRGKDKIYTNTVYSDMIKPIGLPASLTHIISGQAFSWEGDTGTEPYEISAELVKDSDNQYALYNARIDNSTKSIVFHDVPAGKNYTLTIKRLKEIPTQENDLPAKGKFEVYYYETRTGIEVR